MLAQNFKDATELKLTEQQKDALVKTLVLLETGKVSHVQIPSDARYNDSTPKFEGKFNMNRWGIYSIEACGTICCIGGTAELVGGLRQLDLQRACDGNPALEDLFYPSCERFKYDKITPSKAATALRSYLTNGDARWDLALASCKGT